jgi:hypothetical protein
MGFGLVNGLTEQLQNVTTNNYDSISKVHYKYSTYKVFSVFTVRCLMGASKGGRPPSFAFPNAPRPQLPASPFSHPQLSTNSTTSQSYFTTCGLPPISLAWRQAP